MNMTILEKKKSMIFKMILQCNETINSYIQNYYNI